MSRLRAWFVRALASVTRNGRDAELAEELESHLQMQIEENVRRGMSPGEARRQARLRSGGIEAAREAYRDQRGIPVVDHLRRDLRYAARTIRRTPGFAIVAVLSLAVGIGANTAVFSLADAVLLETLPVVRPEELVLLEWIESRQPLDLSYDGSTSTDAKTGLRIATSFSVPVFERLRDRTTTLSAMFAFAPVEQLNVVVDGGADIARGQLVTADYYAALGVRALRGRTIGRDDDRVGAEPVAVITHAFWQRRFGRDPDVVGRRVNINGVGITIIGVTPPEFAGTLNVGLSPDITLPMRAVSLIRPGSAGDLTNPAFWWVQVMGRRREDVSEQRVQSELGMLFRQSVLDQLARRASDSTSKQAFDLPRLQVRSGSRGLNDERDDYRRPVTLLSIVCALVLLIACANVANLLLARSSARRREVAVRLALGGSRARIVAQLLVESLVLVLCAEVFGIVLAYWGKGVLLTLRPGNESLQLALNLRVLTGATALAVATALLFGLAPALRATRVDVAESLKEGARNIQTGSRSLLSRALIVAQIAMSVVLLVNAALFLRTLHNLRAIDAGFDQEQLLLFRIDPRLSRYDLASSPALYRRLEERLSQIAGVRGVSFSRHGQLAGGRRSDDVGVVGRPVAEDRNVAINLVSPGFFSTMQLPMVRGRAFTARDHERAPRVAIVNESFARTFFPNENPLGRRLRQGDSELEIVGVARDAKYYSLRQATEPILYVSYYQHDLGQASFALRTDGDPLTVAPAVRQAIREVDQTLSIFEVRTQRAAVDATLGQERLFAKLSTLFGALALVLSCIGVYGVMAYITARRTSEIGIRLALGAAGRSIVWLVMRRTVMLVGLGIAIGIAGAIGGARLFASLLYDLSTTDPLSLIGAVTIIAAVALIAALVPANRARHVSPIIALRNE